MKYLIILFVLFSSLNATGFTPSEISKAKSVLIQRSISSYSGNCPCPFNRTRNGSRCGKRSAYSRPGGASPLCYETDVTDDMAKKYLKSLKK